MKKGSFVAFLFGAGVPFLLFTAVAYAWTGRFTLLDSSGFREYFILIIGVSIVIGAFTVFTHQLHEGAEEINALGAEFEEGRILIWSTIGTLSSPHARSIALTLSLILIGVILLLRPLLEGAVLIVAAQIFWIVTRRSIGRAFEDGRVPNGEHDAIERLVLATNVIVTVSGVLLIVQVGGYGKVDASGALLLISALITVALRHYWQRLTGAEERPGLLSSGLILLWAMLAVVCINYGLDYRAPISVQTHSPSECPDRESHSLGLPLKYFEGCELAEFAAPNQKIVTTYYRGALALAWHRSELRSPAEPSP